jgi:Ser/Thr protein kinase RdoA (MazF antagonist)
VVDGEDLPPDVRTTVEARYGLRLGTAATPVDGEESVGWRVGSDVGDVLVQLAPAWRATGELRWVHSVLRFAARSLPEVVLPLETLSGETVTRLAGSPITVFPFVAGSRPDVDDAALRTDAARLLARLHVTLAAWRGGDRPPASERSPWRRPHSAEPWGLADPELDRWYEDLARQDPRLLERGVIHGDFYPGNLIARRQRIICVVDWNESHIHYLAQELGWAMWEFAHAADGVSLVRVRAQDFLDDYRAGGRSVSPGEASHLVPFIRLRLRSEIRFSLAAAEAGEDWDPEYTEAELRAFDLLRNERPFE